MKKIGLAIAFLILSSQAASAENISEGKISEIRVGNRVAIVQDNAKFPKGCEKVRHFGMGGSSEENHFMFNALLVAYQSGRDVQLKTTDCIYLRGYSVNITEVILK